MAATMGRSDHAVERALSRMLDLGYGLHESEFALLRAGGSVNEAIEELQSAKQRAPRSQTQPRATVEAGSWTTLRTGPRPRVTLVAPTRQPRSASTIRARMVLKGAANKAVHEVEFVSGMRRDARAHRHVKKASEHDTDHATRAEKAARERRKKAAQAAAEIARCRRHSAMSVKGPSVRELNAQAKKRAAAASIRPGTCGVTETLHATKGGFTGTQLTKMDNALGLFSSYLWPDHPVLEQMSQTLQGDEMPILEDKDLDEENSEENPWLTKRDDEEEKNNTKKSLFDHSGDTSDEEEEAQAMEAAKDGRYPDTSDSGVAQRHIAELDPTRYYRQTSSPIAAAIEARDREQRRLEMTASTSNRNNSSSTQKRPRQRPATAPAGRHRSERRPTQGIAQPSNFGRGGVNASPSELLLGAMGTVTRDGGGGSSSSRSRPATAAAGVRRRPATAGYTRGGGGGTHIADLGGTGFGSTSARHGLHEPKGSVYNQYRSAGPGPGGYNVEAGLRPGVGGKDWEVGDHISNRRSGAPQHTAHYTAQHATQHSTEHTAQHSTAHAHAHAHHYTTQHYTAPHQTTARHALALALLVALHRTALHSTVHRMCL